MREGTVIYLTNTAEIDDDFNENHAIRDLELEPKATILASDNIGYYDMNDAIRMLIVRGAKRIAAIKGFVSNDGRIITVGEPMRMFG